MSNGVNLVGKVLKADEDERIVWGWASVITEKGVPVIDTQGDIIPANVLIKAVNKFMEFVRVGKEQHAGDEIGRLIHSLPVTKELCESLGIQSENEGWIVAMKVYNDDTWSKVKNGELPAFSIGGSAVKREL